MDEREYMVGIQWASGAYDDEVIAAIEAGCDLIMARMVDLHATNPAISGALVGPVEVSRGKMYG